MAATAVEAVIPGGGKPSNMTMMKRLFVLILLFLSVSATFAGIYTPQSVPDPKQWGQDYYVSNPDGILSQAAVDSLNNLAWTLERAAGVEMAIVVLGSFRLTEEQEPNTCELFEFNYELFNLWGIGDAKTNRGLLITVSYDDHQMFISTGTSLDADLPDATCLFIQNNFMLPRFREEDYDRGVIDGVIAIFGYLTDEDVKTQIDDAIESGDSDDSMSMIIGIALLVGIVFLRIRNKFRGGGGSWSSSGGSWGGGSSSSSGSWGGGSTSGGGAGSRW